MRARVESLTTLRLLSARETVAVETPAFLATASRLIRLSFLVGIDIFLLPMISHSSHADRLLLSPRIAALAESAYIGRNYRFFTEIARLSDRLGCREGQQPQAFSGLILLRRAFPMVLFTVLLDEFS